MVNTLGLFPAEDGIFDIPFREDLFTAKVTASPRPAHYVALRYARDGNSQPAGAGLRAAPSSWATTLNTYHSVNANHNWVAGGSSLNEFVFQFSDYVNQVPATDTGPHLRFPNGVTAGTSPLAPQGTEQRKWQFRDDFSWTKTGFGGLGHVLKAGVNVVHEPHLFVSVGQGTSGIFTMGANDVNGPVVSILVIGGNTELNIPIDSVRAVRPGRLAREQPPDAEPWRAMGLRRRYSVQPGARIQTSRSLQAAGRAGRFAGTILDDFGQETRGDKDNVQPRLGFVYDLRGTGREIIRGGWGIYTDFGYTNSNVLTAAIDAAGGGGPVFVANDAHRHPAA